MEHETNKGSEEIIEMFCELCKKKGRSRDAEGFCVDCARYFCLECLAYHSEFLPDHVHEDKKSMPQDVCFQKCPKHEDDIIKFYCKSCDNFFCSACKKKDHENCNGVSLLPLIVTQLEDGHEFKQFKQKLDLLAGEISDTEVSIADNKELVKVNAMEALSKIDSARERMVKWLDKKVDNLKEEVKATQEEDEKTIQDTTLQLSDIKKKVGTLKSKVEQMEREQRRCQLFIAMKDAQKEQGQFFDDIQRLKRRTVKRYEFEESDNALDNVCEFGRLQYKIEGDLVAFPSVEEQKALIATQLQRPLVVNEVWYIIDTRWFKQWKSYVRYESLDHCNADEQSIHPGPIDNSPILKESTHELKEHLIDDLDYVPVPEEGWKKLVSWYGMCSGQTPLPRNVIEDGIYSKSLKIEVYPWHLKLCEYSNEGNQISKKFSRSDTIGRLEQVMRDTFDIPTDKEVRLWNRYLTNMYEPLNKMNSTLQDAGLYEGQLILIEQRNSDNTWPRDKIDTK